MLHVRVESTVTCTVNKVLGISTNKKMTEYTRWKENLERYVSFINDNKFLINVRDCEKVVTLRDMLKKIYNKKEEE